MSMPMTTPTTSTATYESEEELSLLFSDSEQESSQVGDADDNREIISWLVIGVTTTTITGCIPLPLM